MRSGGNLVTTPATMRVSSGPWVGAQISQPSAVTDAVQFIGSMVAWAWNGEPYSAANVFVAEATAAFGPGANVTASASAAVFACQKCSATTATPFGIANAPITPGRPATDAASNFSTAPPNAGAWRTAAYTMPGTMKSRP